MAVWVVTVVALVCGCVGGEVGWWLSAGCVVTVTVRFRFSLWLVTALDTARLQSPC